MKPAVERLSDTWGDIRRSFSDFLAVPSLIVAGFVLIAGGVYLLDREAISWLEPTRTFLKHRLITDPATTNTLLGTIAGGLITVTSITFSLLLIGVQQSATALTNQVLDQFLRRRINQMYFGLFVGASLFALLTLATNDTRVTPVFGAAISLLLTLIALMVLVLLVYTALNQMRPDRVIEAIHDLTLSASAHHRQVLARTRREPTLDAAPATETVRSSTNGFVTDIDIDRIGKKTSTARSQVEVVLLVALGDYVCFDDPVATVSAGIDDEARTIADATKRAIVVERQRSVRHDPSYGVSQLATVGWTSISSAKSNPAPGLAVIRNLRDLLTRWSENESHPAPLGGAESAPSVPVVYRDETMHGMMDALESLLIASSESMQHQCAAEVLHTIAVVFERMPHSLKDRAEDVVLRGLSSLGDHVLAADLDRTMTELATVLGAAGRSSTAAAVARAHAALAKSVGELGSRSTRTPA